MSLERAVETMLEKSPNAEGQDCSQSVLQRVYEAENGDQGLCGHNATVFRAKMPGALTLQEVQEQIDLGKWNLKFGNRLVNLEVRAVTMTIS